jgi:predicted CoA-binding protein
MVMAGDGRGADAGLRRAVETRNILATRVHQRLGQRFAHDRGSMNEDINTLRRILKHSKTIAVVGLSANWWRPSFFAAKYLQEHGYRVIPVNPQYQEVLGHKCYPTLSDIPDKVDIVDCFRRSEDIGPIAQEAIAIGAKVLWMQLGVINHDAADKARKAGLDVVMDRCVKIEHARLFGGLNWAGVNTKVISSKRPQWLAY